MCARSWLEWFFHWEQAVVLKSSNPLLQVRVLVKEPRGGKEVKGEGDVFYFDARFPAQKLFRIKISAIHVSPQPHRCSPQATKFIGNLSAAAEQLGHLTLLAP